MLEQVDVEEYFGTDQDLRKNVKTSFNFDIFKSLSNLLTETEKTELALLNETYRKKRDALPPNLRRKEFERLTVELAWKSSKIEGNTYTLLDTERLLKENVSAKGKTAEETKMVLNHKTALDYVLQSPEYFRRLSVSKIEEVHRLLTSGLQVASGIRQGMVGIVGTNYHLPANGYQIKEALQYLISTVNQTENPVEKALRMPYPARKQKRRSPVVKFLFLILLLCTGTANSQTLSDVDWKTATPEQIQKLIDDGASVTDDLLILAAGFNSNPAVIEALIKAQADVNARNKDGVTPLMAAAMNNSNPAVIEALIKAKADVNAQIDGRFTPLMFAAMNNSNPAVIEALIKAKADVNARDKDGFTPLMFAARDNSNSAVIEALIKAKADVNARKKDGFTPLMAAAGFNSNPAVIEALIKAKADVNARNKSGKTAFDYAEDNPEIKGTPVYWKLNDLMYK